MRKKQQLDERIADIVQSLKLSPSSALEAKVERALEGASPVLGPRKVFLIRRLIVPAISFAGAVLLAVFLAVLFLQKSPDTSISEIRTEFELPEKNITGIFIQRKNFDFFEEEHK
jgi:hypothetical protein